jgi:hemerythrin-like domain-containing protein
MKSKLDPAASRDGFAALDAHHRKTLAMLEDLSMLVARLGQGSPDTAMAARAAKIATYFSTAAQAHHEDEERHVFPALVAHGNADIVQAVLRLQEQHDWLEEDWFDLAPQVHAVATGRPFDVDALSEGVAVLAALYQDHIELEESYLYPEARKHILPDARRAMAQEIAARHRAERASRRRSGNDAAAAPIA